jgi:group I intron endonuclease
MKICGIYAIKNIINKKVYIGQSNNILSRFSNHKYELNNSKHSNSHLQRAWHKYGKENFIFEILCECSPKELNEKEIYFIGLYCSFENGYNRTDGGTNSEVVAEFGRKMAKILHETKRTTKNKCLICGEETKDGYNKYCTNHKKKCIKCGKRFGDNNLYLNDKNFKTGYLCSDCEWNLVVSNINIYNQTHEDKIIIKYEDV